MTAAGLYLGFDYGARQIGVAVGQSATGSARPLCILPAREGQPDWTQLAALLQEWQPQALVVGLPLHMDGSEGESAARARKFAARLHGRFG
ncbi:MAG: Holliday junction resolvase RuvX, partial [Pseudomonadales bacterium]|nr:Holliday junction resolvase RuvX [Pseudomonadales bacterium]